MNRSSSAICTLVANRVRGRCCSALYTDNDRSVFCVRGCKYTTVVVYGEIARRTSPRSLSTRGNNSSDAPFAIVLLF